MFDDAKGFIVCQGLDIPHGIKCLHIDSNMWMVDKRLHKFVYDEILYEDDNECFFLDGYVLNKDAICQKSGMKEWKDAFMRLLHEKKSPYELRGAFCGFWKQENLFTLFVDHIGNRVLYYYCQNGILVLSSKIYFIIELLKYWHVPLQVDEQAAKYMLEQGFMLDDTTFACEIKRVCPGNIVEIQDDCTISKRMYYLVDNTAPVLEMTEEEAINGINYYFRQAIKREFDKDREYGYKHLVDLSGGLDSRMTCWCAHEMGFVEQVNFTYCSRDYLDFKIAQEIALKLRHTFFYMPLDDFKWYREVDSVLKKNNGAAIYCGITGGERFLNFLDCKHFGIEHTGMVGDAILSTFFNDEDYNYARPIGNENAYSQIVKYDIPLKVRENFENREQFSVYTRGLLGAQSSYMTRQEYVETSSPFLDVDFLNFVFTIPFKYRRKHYIYLKWIASKYPEAAEFGWEKWFGVLPKASNLWRKRIANIENVCLNKIKGKLGVKSNDGMNPVDYWLSNNQDIEEWIKNFFHENLRYLNQTPDIKNEVDKVFDKGNALEKAQALTVVIMIKYIVSEKI